MSGWLWRHPDVLCVLGAALAATGGWTLLLSLIGLYPPFPLLIKIMLALCCAVGLRMIADGWRRKFSYDWVCSRCGRESLVRWKFCPICGGEMVPKPIREPKCPKGHTVPKYADYCPKCGEKVVRAWTGRKE